MRSKKTMTRQRLIVDADLSRWRTPVSWPSAQAGRPGHGLGDSGRLLGPAGVEPLPRASRLHPGLAWSVAEDEFVSVTEMEMSDGRW